jgi:hypothetical protein
VNYRNTLQSKSQTLAAGARVELEIGVADFLYFETFPSGLKAGWNSAHPGSVPAGTVKSGPPGAGNFRRLEIVNASAGSLTFGLYYGQGSFAVAGSAGSSGGGSSLVAAELISGRRPRIAALAAGESLTVAGARYLDVFNKSTTANLTLTVSGQPAYTLGPREGVPFPLLSPSEGAYSSVLVECPAGGSGVVAYVL